MSTATHDQAQVEEFLRAFTRLRKILRKAKLSFADYHTLLLLRKSESMTPGKIGEETLTLPVSITRTLNCLQGAGLVTRRIAEHDRRKVEVNLTEQGASLLEKIDDLIPDLYG